MSSDWNESELRDAVHRAAGEVDIGGPSFERVAAASRRRRTTALVGTVAAVVVIGTGTAAGVGAFHGGGSTALNTAGSAKGGLSARYCPPDQTGTIEWPPADQKLLTAFDGPTTSSSPVQTGPSGGKHELAVPQYDQPPQAYIAFKASEVVICVYPNQTRIGDAAVISNQTTVAQLESAVNQADEPWTRAKSCTDKSVFDTGYLIFTERGPDAEIVSIDLTPCFGWLTGNDMLVRGGFSQSVEALVGRTIPEAPASK